MRDTGYLNGQISELTFDYFAQDVYGNVWYFGEDTTQYKHGKPVGHVGSWLTGVNGAQPGIVMEGTPRVGDTYMEENAPGIAQDEATNLSLTASVSTPYGNFIGNVLETREFSKIEPHSGELKYYAPNVGFVKNVARQQGGEVLALAAIK